MLLYFIYLRPLKTEALYFYIIYLWTCKFIHAQLKIKLLRYICTFLLDIGKNLKFEIVTYYPQRIFFDSHNITLICWPVLGDCRPGSLRTKLRVFAPHIFKKQVTYSGILSIVCLGLLQLSLHQGILYTIECLSRPTNSGTSISWIFSFPLRKQFYILSMAVVLIIFYHALDKKEPRVDNILKLTIFYM